MKLFFRLTALALAAAIATPAAAGTLVVGGDVTPTFSLSASPSSGGDPGNRQFYDNVRGGATGVVISQRGFNTLANDNLARFYRETAGVQVTETSSDITTDLLAGAGLLVLQFPNDAFAGAEMMAIGDYVRAGGSLLLVGEASTVNTTSPAPPLSEGSQANANLNGLLAGIGSTIRINDDTIGCCGQFTATGGAIGADPLTAGVSTFTYGAATSVSGGTALFFAPDANRALQPFFATEQLTATVPEPASWALMIGGIAVVGGVARRRRRVLVDAHG